MRPRRPSPRSRNFVCTIPLSPDPRTHAPTHARTHTGRQKGSQAGTLTHTPTHPHTHTPTHPHTHTPTLRRHARKHAGTQVRRHASTQAKTLRSVPCQHSSGDEELYEMAVGTLHLQMHVLTSITQSDLKLTHISVRFCSANHSAKPSVNCLHALQSFLLLPSRCPLETFGSDAECACTPSFPPQHRYVNL